MDYCTHCSNTGKFKQIKDEEEFDRVFDYYDKTGVFAHDQCYDKAIKAAGYTVITPCPHCGRAAK